MRTFKRARERGRGEGRVSHLSASRWLMGAWAHVDMCALVQAHVRAHMPVLQVFCRHLHRHSTAKGSVGKEKGGSEEGGRPGEQADKRAVRTSTWRAPVWDMRTTPGGVKYSRRRAQTRGIVVRTRFSCRHKVTCTGGSRLTKQSAYSNLSHGDVTPPWKTFEPF